MQDEGIDLYCVEDPLDLLYLLGIRVSNGAFLITKDQECFFTDTRYLASLAVDFPFERKELCQEGITDFLSLFKPSQIKKFGQCGRTLEHDRYVLREGQLKKRFRKAKSVSLDLISRVRMVKDSKEIQAIQSSADLCWKGYQYVLGKLMPGVTEQEIAKEFELFVKGLGAEKLAFDVIVAFGDHTANPHHKPTKRRLKKRDLIMLDLGVVYNDYASDMTRTVVKGAPTEKIELFAACIHKGYLRLLEHCRPGVRFSELNALFCQTASECGLDKYLRHSLGHGVGLNIHEYPSCRKECDDLLKEGMVITMEPGLYEQGVGGIRLENLFLITKDGCQNFYPEIF